MGIEPIQFAADSSTKSAYDGVRLLGDSAKFFSIDFSRFTQNRKIQK
ncbi:MAG: hypothetical protein F6K39_21115 [Okeania sp. SIO3B3]|nr:hypothetical protein [Okeania sp. SIO3B3]